MCAFVSLWHGSTISLAPANRVPHFRVSVQFFNFNLSFHSLSLHLLLTTRPCIRPSKIPPYKALLHRCTMQYAFHSISVRSSKNIRAKLKPNIQIRHFFHFNRKRALAIPSQIYIQICSFQILGALSLSTFRVCFWSAFMACNGKMQLLLLSFQSWLLETLRTLGMPSNNFSIKNN